MEEARILLQKYLNFHKVEINSILVYHACLDAIMEGMG